MSPAAYSLDSLFVKLLFINSLLVKLEMLEKSHGGYEMHNFIQFFVHSVRTGYILEGFTCFLVPYAPEMD